MSKQIIISSEDNHQQMPSIEEIFDEMIFKIEGNSTISIIEDSVKDIFSATTAILWLFHEKNFYSPTNSISVNSHQTLLINAFNSRSPLSYPSLKETPNHNEKFDGQFVQQNQPILLFSIYSRSNQCCGIFEFARKPDKPFVSHEIIIASYVQEKFNIYSPFLFPDSFIISEISKIPRPTSNLSSIISPLQKIMHVRTVEVWLYYIKKGDLLKFSDDPTLEENPFHYKTSNSGAVFNCLETNSLLSTSDIRMANGYNQNVDGFFKESVLIIPQIDPNHKRRRWAIVLRGRLVPSYFQSIDIIKASAFAPFIIKILSEAYEPMEASTKMTQNRAQLEALLEIAESLTGILDLDKLIPLIMKKSCDLLKAVRCSLFIIDNNELVARFHGGLEKAIKIPMGKGIVGSVAISGIPISIKDAYSDSRFDQAIDKKTGFRTLSILALPIFSTNGQIIGVTEMINKRDGTSFTESDEKLMTGFNVFCGISLDNAKLYSASISLTHRIRSFVDMTSALTTKGKIRNVLEEILENARNITHAYNASIFLVSPDKTLIRLFTIGSFVHQKEAPKLSTESHNKQSNGISFISEASNKDNKNDQIFNDARKCNQMRKIILTESRKEIDDSISEQSEDNLQSAIQMMLENESLLEKEANHLGSASSSRIMQAIHSNSVHLDGHNDIRCSIPLTGADGKNLGVITLEAQKLGTEDLKFLDSISIFISAVIERDELKNISQWGSEEIEFQNYVSKIETTLIGQIPAKLLLPKDKEASIWTSNFDSLQWDGVGHISMLFAIFNRFGLLKSFNVTNEKFYRFVTEIRDTYKKIPYHNWIHAADVTQFIAYQIITGDLEKFLSPFEIFALLVAAICHDANHDGYSNIYNEKAETPLGILFKNQSVMETHHCAISIDVISKETSNIFESFDPDQLKTMWTYIIELILGTDMAKHHDILNEFNNLEQKGELNFSNEKDRLLYMKILLKAADVSNAARPFEIADKWCDVLCEEFFRQGDLEKTNGMEYTSPLNDRAHLNKAKSQVGFYSYVVLPLFQATVAGSPKLSCNVDQVRSNLSQWKKNRKM